MAQLVHSAGQVRPEGADPEGHRPEGEQGPQRAVAVWGREAARRVAAAGRYLADRWRRSLQFRVVALTIVLCLIVIGLLGAYLYKAIAAGLEADRIRSAQAEAQTLTVIAQSTLDATPTATADELSSATSSLVEQKLAPPPTDPSRYVVMIRGLRNTSQTVIGQISTGNLSVTVIPSDLREAVAADPQHQQTKLIEITDPATRTRVPAVVVGSQVKVSTVGAYDLYFVYPMERETTTLNHIANSFVIGGLILVLLVGAVAWVVTRQVVVPIRRAAGVAQRLSSGELGERMSARGHDELAALGQSFNAMADSLQNQIHQLEGLSRVQQRFVSDVSHELRTPLTTVRMAADLIHDSRDDFTATVARSAELLHNELDRFEELLSDLLEISRFDAGAAALDTDPTDVRAVVDKVVAASQRIAEVRGSQISVVSDGSPTVAELDPRRVERILRNLVVNAIEHGEGGPVTIHVAGNESAVAVVVEDRGVGLRPGEASLVFNRFWRADPARTRTTGGTGLGLAIALEDARLHNGWLQAWGELGAGSRFRLTLPRTQSTTIESAPLALGPAGRRRR